MSLLIRVNSAPPVAKRPRCPQCDKSLRPYWRTIKEENIPAPDFRRYTVEWQGEYHGYGAFDTQRCAVAFANDVIKQRRR